MKRAACLLILGATVVLAAACSSGGGSNSSDGGVLGNPTGARIVFAYDAPTALNPSVRAAFPGCVQIVGPTHTHPSWRDFAVVAMRAVSDSRWELTMQDVPAGQQVVIGVNDPNLCTATNDRGRVFSNFTANGVALSRTATTVSGHGDGGMGLAFTVDADGNVTP